ncbi:DUF2442 domain-containing protein [Bythopirellula goksoeyrii]|uniref:DUF2442 domain-containing protein n=1 Tax=Bythopirellula goksoeyrii TaxID=1400387 RepID=A0A5B9QF45_9BACT|nr:DUF2442 domain-containing protein [Bythopirellula goksoeyrii]QEG35526.1 hypothetical protein Pr1d_28270 [Bythopirellula goksoeyrii]
MSTSTIDTSFHTASKVSLNDVSLTVDLTDGRTISVPLAWFPRLLHGTPTERQNWRLIAGGTGIHWADLDEDISVENLLSGKSSGESQSSLQKWLALRTSTSPRE